MSKIADKFYADFEHDNVATYINENMNDEVQQFQKSAAKKTGFSNLDNIAGGVYPGLYVIGAISSLGKTTFIHQLADQMATAGEQILFFSLEQSRLELVSKSLARLTAQMKTSQAITSLDIRNGNVDDGIKEIYLDTAAKNMSIIEGEFDTNISYITNYVGSYIRTFKRKPIVVVDYLQILQGDPAQSKKSTKEMVDTNVTELKRLSRKHNIPVFVISSINRTNYLSPVDFESFKESGGIEYTADVVWGLQLSVVAEDEIFEKDGNQKAKRDAIRKAKAQTPRNIQLVCLKNRYGVCTYEANFEYFPQYDFFVPAEKNTQPKRKTR